MQIRRVAQSDFAHVSQFLRVLNPDLQSEFLLDNFQQIVGDHRAILLLAEQDGIVCGFIEVQSQWSLQSGFHGVIRSMFVAENFRRKGIAGELMSKALEMARAMGVSKMIVQARLERHEASQFYAKMGFAKTKVQTVFTKRL